jgi:hypothetical protein
MAYTTNNYFYKPAIGAQGSSEKAKYDAALDALDLIIKALYDDSHEHDNSATLDATEEAFTEALKTAYDAAEAKAHEHSNISTLDAITAAFTTALKSSYDGAVTDSHTHANSAILDAIEVAFTDTLKSAYDGAVSDSHSHTNKSTLDAIEEALTSALKTAYDDAVTKAHTHDAKSGAYGIEFSMGGGDGEHNRHFQVKIGTVNNPVDAEHTYVVDVESKDSQTAWTYWNGENIVAVPSDGVLHIHKNRRVGYLIPDQTLSYGQTYQVFVRIYNTELEEYGDWTWLERINPGITG